MIINHIPRNIAGNHVSAQLEGNWTPFTDFKLERQQEIETYYSCSLSWRRFFFQNPTPTPKKKKTQKIKDISYFWCKIIVQSSNDKTNMYNMFHRRSYKHEFHIYLAIKSRPLLVHERFGVQ